MIRLEFLRRQAKLSQRGLGEMCSPRVGACYICNAEKRGMKLYASQAQRLADALGWTGDPEELFEEVEAV